jgi:hypothetical protein
MLQPTTFHYQRLHTSALLLVGTDYLVTSRHGIEFVVSMKTGCAIATFAEEVYSSEERRCQHFFGGMANQADSDFNYAFLILPNIS